MGYNPTLKETQRAAKDFIDANVWDGEDRSGANWDVASFTPDDLQELVDDLIENLRDRNFI